MSNTKHWEGVPGASEHRTTGQRAWCYTDNEWCYSDILCPCCLAASDEYMVCPTCESVGFVKRPAAGDLVVDRFLTSLRKLAEPDHQRAVADMSTAIWDDEETS